MFNLSPGGEFRDGVAFSMVAALVSEVVDGLLLALRVCVGPGAANYNDGVGLVVFV